MSPLLSQCARSAQGVRRECAGSAQECAGSVQGVRRECAGSAQGYTFGQNLHIFYKFHEFQQKYKKSTKTCQNNVEILKSSRKPTNSPKRMTIHKNSPKNLLKHTNTLKLTSKRPKPIKQHTNARKITLAQSKPLELTRIHKNITKKLEKQCSQIHSKTPPTHKNILIHTTYTPKHSNTHKTRTLTKHRPQH